MSVKRFPIEPAIEIDPRTEEEEETGEEERGRGHLRIYLMDIMSGEEKKLKRETVGDTWRAERVGITSSYNLKRFPPTCTYRC